MFQLPFDLILTILRDDNHNNLYLLNKECTEEYFKRLYIKIKDHTNVPIFDKPLFQYFSFVTHLYLYIWKMKDLGKWATFPYSSLINCKYINGFVKVNSAYRTLKNSRMTRQQSKELKLEKQMFIKMKKDMPQLNTFDVYGELCDLDVLKIFKDSNLEEIHLREGLNPTKCNIINNMRNLSTLGMTTVDGLVDCGVIFPLITKINEIQFENLSVPKMLNFFSKLDLIFPELKEFVLDSLFQDDLDPIVEIVNLIPSSVETLQVVLYDNDYNWSRCNSFHDTIVVNYVCSTNQNISVLTYLQQYTNQWVFAVGNPAFLIATNISNWSVIQKHSKALHAGDATTVDLIDPKFFKSQHNKCFHIHISHKQYADQEDDENLDTLTAFGLFAISTLPDGVSLSSWAMFELDFDTDDSEDVDDTDDSESILLGPWPFQYYDSDENLIGP